MLPTTSARRWRKVATQGAQSYTLPWFSKADSATTVSCHSKWMYVCYHWKCCWKCTLVGVIIFLDFFIGPAIILLDHCKRTWSSVESIYPWFLPDYIQSEVKKIWRDTNRYDLRPSTVDDSDFFQWWFHFERTTQHSKRKRWGLLHPIFWHKKNISM